MAGFIQGTLTDIVALTNGGADRRLYQDIVEFQKQTNPILEELVLTQCNNKTVHKATVRTALPEIAWRMLNRGVVPTKSGKAQVTFSCGVVEALAQIDELELKYYDFDNMYRLQENRAHQIAMNNKMAQTLFYGNEKVNPAGFTGLGAYYFSKDPAKCKAADYVIDAGGTGNNLTSLYMVVWSTNTICGIYPEDTVAGFEYIDNGRQKSYDDKGGELYVYESQYRWNLGLAVRDYRYAVRICNIDTSAIDSGFIDRMIDAYYRIENVNAGKAAIYCNRQTNAALTKIAQGKSNVNLTVESFGGKPVVQFYGMPIRMSDGILNTEEQVV